MGEDRRHYVYIKSSYYTVITLIKKLSANFDAVGLGGKGGRLHQRSMLLVGTERPKAMEANITYQNVR